ncbi:chemotaxis protein CheB [Antarctobacter jejuensis]|uniref:chemotaxis protein CheB n=1 Tax=Antarctobacter jejuensis TaxID=1439938 RepID=UPI003FD324A2
MSTNAPVETVVAVAASAGGLEAITLLLQHLSPDLGCAYILAQHMSPNHASMLPAILSRETPLKIATVEGSMPLEPDTVYVSVPRSDLVVEGGAVHLREPSDNVAEPKPSADRLFTSIAQEFGENCVGIVLSGTGCDGSYGVQAIREVGGITIAQDSASAKYDSMPMASIETGCIDLILSPRQMGEQLSNILTRPRNFATLQADLERSTGYDDLFKLLQAHTRVNFRHYKENTVSRRIQRRMVTLGFEHYDQYLGFCRTHPQELDALYRDLLISVTRFFRDPDQFQALATGLERYVRANEGSNPLRVWVAGCATGEEAYSIAFILCDLLGYPQNDGARRIQIFATDLDDAALARGRAGAYPSNAATGIPRKMVETYFTVHDDVLRVRPEIRNLVLFSQHNVFQDPPFSEIDLVSLRNTLIYFDTPLQEKVMSRVLYALRPGGLLFLGTSESIGAMEPYFERGAERARLYRKRGGASFDKKALIRFGIPAKADPEGQGRKSGSRRTSEDNELFAALAQTVAPVGFLVNEQKDMIRIFGDISIFTRITDDVRGRLSINMLKPEISSEAASLIPLCLKHGKARNGLWRDMTGHGFNRVRLRGYPIAVEAGSNNRMVLVAIETDLIEDVGVAGREDIETTDYLTYLENELVDAREALQITMEELQTSNEELQSTNEELQSTNEELQSTNEELETSNEELQSTNEELITVNEELLVNSDELNRLVAEQDAIQTALPLPLLVLDQSLNIKSASQNAVHLFRLSERGAHLGHISQITLPSADFPKLVDVCSDVLTRLKTRIESFEYNGHRQELRVSPYFLKGSELAGLTLTIQRA